MRRIGLVLGAGGMAGQAYHAGVLSALADGGWDPRSAEVIVGTSAGSISAALLRAMDEQASERRATGQSLAARHTWDAAAAAHRQLYQALR